MSLKGAHLADAVERALRLDAVAVVCAILSFPGQPELTWDCLRNVDQLRALCEPYGLPLFVETLAMTVNDDVTKLLRHSKLRAGP